jgi:hypothetical protein
VLMLAYFAQLEFALRYSKISEGRGKLFLAERRS